MIYIILIIIIVLLLIADVFLYFRTSHILRSLDEMLDEAINDTFTERHFNENRLSRLETKLYRYLTAGKTAQRQITSEKDAVKELVSDISHQTKTPIANIMLYTQLLAERDCLDEKSREMVMQLEMQADKLSFLIQALVKTSRLENGIVTVTPKENRLDKLSCACENCRLMAHKKDIKLEVQEMGDLTAVYDEKWTVEAVFNIVDNAVKYTPCGGKIGITAKEYEMFVCLSIEDTGIGMTEEETAQIFGRFWRSPRVNREQGVGIGLYLAREIISKQGGYIKVVSELGKGSIFQIYLPKQMINIVSKL